MSTMLPSLRVVALTYTGLAGVAALVVVVAAAVTPRAPILEEVSAVTGPARQVVTTLVQPPTDMVASFVPAAAQPSPVAVGAKPTPYVASTRLDVVIDSPPAVLNVRIAPMAASPAGPSYVSRVAPVLAVQDDTSSDVDDSSDDMDLSPVGDPMPVQQIVEAPPTMQMASVASPQPLPTPTPTVVIPTTVQQVKAQTDAANQAAIDAAKAAAAAQKARDDAANQAAIDAQKAAVAKAKH